MKFGVDVSERDHEIAWNKVKTDFTIIRCGFGSNVISQHDKYYDRNVAQCEKYSIPYGIYLYSYATSEMQLNSEVEHVQTQLQKCGKKPFCVFLDMEDKSTVELGKATLTSYALKFCNEIKKIGYQAGIYANQNWFTNYLDAAKIADAGYIIWCAKYSNNPPEISINYDIWQYTSLGKMPGISGDVDLNYMCTDLFVDDGIHKTVNELATEVIAGKWGNGTERKNKLTAAGYDYYTVQKRVNELLNSSLDQIARSVINGDWGNGHERRCRLEAAGYDYYTVQNKVNEILGIK